MYTDIYILCSMCAHLCLMLCKPMDCSPGSSSVHEILQERILEWVSISSSRDFPSSGFKLSFPVPLALVGSFFTTVPLRKPILID